MLEILIGYLPTVLLVVALGIAVAAVLIRMRRNRKQGKSSCGCGCNACGQCAKFGQDKNKEREA